VSMRSVRHGYVGGVTGHRSDLDARHGRIPKVRYVLSICTEIDKQGTGVDWKLGLICRFNLSGG